MQIVDILGNKGEVGLNSQIREGLMRGVGCTSGDSSLARGVRYKNDEPNQDCAQTPSGVATSSTR